MIALIARRWGGPDGGPDGMAVASARLAWTLAELGHQVACYLPETEREPWQHRRVDWRHRSPTKGPDDWSASLTICTSQPTWPTLSALARKAGALDRLAFWHHYGPEPAGSGAILLRVAAGGPAKGWGRVVTLPPSSWAAESGGDRKGSLVVVPGAGSAKGSATALAVARSRPDLGWAVLAGRASEAELRPWRELGALVIPCGSPQSAWLDLARAVLSPTRSETYGLCLVEAAVRGIPVVCSDLPGPRSALGDVGRYLPPDAPAWAWEKALQEAMAGPERRLTLPSYRATVRQALGPWLVVQRPEPVKPVLELPLSGRRGLVSVLMAVGPVHRWLGEAVRSVLEQELPAGWQLELLLGIDGVPESLAAARALPPDPRVGIVSFPEPVGTYRVANALLGLSSGELVTRSDADDVQQPGRLAELIGLFRQDPQLGLVNTYYCEADEETLEPTKRLSGPADGVWCYRRALLDSLGGWRPWPCAADSELVGRAKALGARWQLFRRHLYLARTHRRQLTTANGTALGSDLRQTLARTILDERESYQRGAAVLRVERETLPVERSGARWGEQVWACLAAIPGRREILGQVIGSLLGQVDRLGVYLNGWDDAPECLDDPRIMVARSQEHGDRGDAGKMFWADEAPGYYLSCDDDILYPQDYAARLVGALKERGNRAVVGCHGVILNPHVDCYRRDRRVLRFGSALDEDTPVHLLGTGAAGWHAPTLRIPRAAFRVPNMADVWLAEIGQQQRIPFWCLRREAGWLRDIDCAYQDSIFRHGEQGTGSDRDKGATELEVIQRLAPWHIWAAEETTMDSTYRERDFWQQRYSSGLDSGPGSGGEEAAWKVEQVVRACSRKKVGSVLDLGCGDGRVARALMDRLPGASYLGIDQAPAALEQARRVALPGMEFREGDLTGAELSPADLVLCLDVLFHLESAERHEAAIAAVCRAFRKVAIVAAWNAGIVELYRGEFAPHTVYRPFVVTDPAVKVEEIKLPMVGQKSLFILTRPRRK